MENRIVKVRAIYEFEVDVSDFNPNFVDLEGLAKDLTRREVSTLKSDDFEYEIVEGA